MLGLIKKLWRRHKVKAAEHRIYRDQGRSSGHGMDDAQRMMRGESWPH
jgi:hypothetical protein